ncbi:MAG: response regulator, partial [Spirochaetota bacterium]|nr:response regulator [Spirochaetota bacterium]
MNEYVHVLYIDDYPPDRELVRDALVKEHTHFKLTEATSRIEFEEILKHNSFDIVLSDFNILGFEGLSVIDTVYAKDPSIPVIIVTGTGTEQIAVDAMKRGAYDYVIKTPYHIRRLPATINSTLKRKQLEEENIQAHADLLRKKAEQSVLLNTIDTHIWYLSDFETYGMVNKAHADFFGLNISDIEYKRIGELLPKKTIESNINRNQRVFNNKKEIRTEEILYNCDGEKRLFEITRTPKLDENEIVEFVVCTGIDITERRKAEEELKKYRNHLEEVIEERTNDLRNAQEKLITSERLAVLGRLTGSISHELRNPLAIIDSSAYCLNKTFTDIPNPKAMIYVERIKKQVVRSIA